MEPDPQEYHPYVKRILDYSAATPNIRFVLFDLHGLPGSQNGEMHSGLMTDWEEKQGQYCTTDWNEEKALEAVENMAKYIQAYVKEQDEHQEKQYHVEEEHEKEQKETAAVEEKEERRIGQQQINKGRRISPKTIYAIQILNENQGDAVSPEWLFRYYKKAVARIRAVTLSLPVVVFGWTYDFPAYETLFAQDCASSNCDHVHPLSAANNVLWDTHIYHGFEGEQDSVDQLLADWSSDLEKVKQFQSETNTQILVGEWTLAMRGGGIENGKETQAAAHALVQRIDDVCLGSFFWNFRAPGNWGFFHHLNTQNWREVFDKQRKRFSA
eukprot:TRINITY_DN15342_c0_g2_i1.p1 TRINITY_DN15342_c0_g2~~TRINITY_DN15342_c0_g2_i1.p1  ORF type:complete len:326 (+),score=47.93 TRINITY_DN15342_c0_g2_i1:74-1051(+)